MKTVEKVVKEVTEEEVIGASCDWCEKEFDDITVKCEGYGQVEISFGYGSSHDEDVYKGEICDGCFEKIFKKKMRKMKPSGGEVK